MRQQCFESINFIIIGSLSLIYLFESLFETEDYLFRNNFLQIRKKAYGFNPPCAFSYNFYCCGVKGCQNRIFTVWHLKTSSENLSKKMRKSLENQGSHKDTFKRNRLRDDTQPADSTNLRVVCLSAYFLDIFAQERCNII